MVLVLYFKRIVIQSNANLNLVFQCLNPILNKLDPQFDDVMKTNRRLWSVEEMGGLVYCQRVNIRLRNSGQHSPHGKKVSLHGFFKGMT